MRGTIGSDMPFTTSDPFSIQGGALLAASRPSPWDSFISLAQNLHTQPTAYNNIYNIPLMRNITVTPRPNITPMRRVKSNNIAGTPISPFSRFS